MSETTHTPGPWHVEPESYSQWHGMHVAIFAPPPAGTKHCQKICILHDYAGSALANAERIVLCHNAHDDLVAALEVLLRESMAPTDDGGRWDDACAFARQVLAKAGEK